MERTVHKHFPAKRGKTLCLFMLFLCTVLLLSGCNTTKEESEPITTTGFKLNTAVTITIYDSGDRELLTECMELCDKYERIFSRTLEASELYRLNHRSLLQVKETENTYLLSDELADLIQTGLFYSAESGGAFDIAIAPLTALWDFTSENPKVPDPEAIRKAASACGSDGVRLNGNEITVPSDETAFDLGALAKGYIADRLKDHLLSRGVRSATINLGGNVLCIGNKPDGSPFRIGIQKPFADRNETTAIVEITDQSVVSSGIYERCFEENGTLYHHILDPSTGYPCDNGLIAVTIISDRSVDGDALSTLCFALGYEKGLEYAQSHNIAAVFITDDYKLHYTEAFPARSDT